MDDQQRLETMGAILSALDQNPNVRSPAIPISVLRRLAMLTGGKDLKFADSYVTPSDHGRRVSGEVVVMTDNIIIQATLQATPKDETRAFTVNVEAWARRDLTSLHIVPDEDEGRNPDSSWAESWREWPPQCFITLKYGNRNVHLPVAPDPSKWLRERLTNLLPSLLDDLSRGK